MANDVKAFLLRVFQDVVDGDRVIADSGLMPPEVPELGACRAKGGVVSGVGRSSVVDKPNVVA